MRIFNVFKHDLRAQFSRPIPALTFIAVAFMPILYSGFLIRGNWDPYGQLQELPVAVVNLDRGAEYEGKFFAAGDDFLEELKNDETFNWRIVSLEEAERGMAANEYYAMITVPEDFSERTVSIGTDNPRQAELVYEANGYHNFIAAQISQNATRELKSELSVKITEAYTRSIIERAAELTDGLREASGGAGELAEGSTAIADGIGKMREHLLSLASGADDLADGAARLRSGAGGLADAASAVTGGADAIADGIGRLANAAASASRHLGDSAAQLYAAQQQLEASSEQLAAGQAEALRGIRQVGSGLEQLRQGVASLRTGQQELYGGIRQLNAKLPELAAGGAELAQGARQIGEGAGALTANLGKLADGANRLRGGAAGLADGAAGLYDGTGKLAGGAAELRDRLSDAAERTDALRGDDRLVGLLANPVNMLENEERKVTNYGSGIAPYFLSLAFFAGALIYSNTFPIRSSYDPDARGLSLFVGKLLAYGLMGIIQALIASTIVIYALGLRPASVPMFYLYTAIVSLTFMFLVQMLTTWLERPGQFIALVLLILQLVSSAGTFPYELLPSWAQALHPWMPMSYSVIGYRDVISVGSFEDMRAEAGKLLLILLASVALIGVFYRIQNGRRKGNDETRHPSPAPHT